MLLNQCYAAPLIYGPSGMPFTGRIRSFSVRGIALAGCRHVASGAVVTIVLKHVGDDFQCDRTAKVVHSRPGRSGSIISFEFLSPLTEEEFEHFQSLAQIRGESP